MSVRVMSEVFARYPNGGGEMLLALAIADHAQDDGTEIRPSVSTLAKKTRQSVRTVQYQLRKMEQIGWLIPVGHVNGGRSKTTRYCISYDWINGADAAPISSEEKGADIAPNDTTKGADIAPINRLKGATDDSKGCNPRHKRVQRVAPARNHPEPSGNRNTDSARQTDKKSPAEKSKTKLTQRDLKNDYDIPADLAAEFLQIRKDKKLTLTPTAMKRLCSEFGKAELSVPDGIELCCARSWGGFKASWDWQENANGRDTNSRRRGGEHRLSTAERFWQRYGAEVQTDG